MSSSTIRNRVLSNDEGKDNIAMSDLKPELSDSTYSMKTNYFNQGIVEKILNKILPSYSAVGEVLSLFGEGIKKVTSYANTKDTHAPEAVTSDVKPTDIPDPDSNDDGKGATISCDLPLKSDNELAKAHFIKGDELNYSKHFHEAIIEFDKGLALDKDCAFAYFKKGDALTGLGQYKEAIIEFDNGLAIDKDCPYAYFKKGNSYLKLKHPQHAIAEFNKALSINPQLSDCYLGRGIAFHLLKQHDNSMAETDEAIKCYPKNMPAHQIKVVCLLNLKKYDEALKAIETACIIEANNSTLVFLRGYALVCGGNSNEALSECAEALEMNPNDATLYKIKGVALHHLGKYEEAIAEYNKSSNLNSQYCDVYIYKARSLIALGNYKDAGIEIEEALKLDPAHTYAQELKAVILQNLASDQQNAGPQAEAAETDQNPDCTSPADPISSVACESIADSKQQQEDAFIMSQYNQTNRDQAEDSAGVFEPYNDKEYLNYLITLPNSEVGIGHNSHVEEEIINAIKPVAVTDTPQNDAQVIETPYTRIIRQFKPEDFEKLDKACDDWSERFFQLMHKGKNGIKELVEDKNFKTILAMHNHMQNEHKDMPTPITDFLYYLVVRKWQDEFNIPYTFITHKPIMELGEGEVGFLGYVSELDNLLKPYYNQE